MANRFFTIIKDNMQRIMAGYESVLIINKIFFMVIELMNYRFINFLPYQDKKW